MLLKQAEDTYGRMSSFRCKGIFQTESGFADAFNMSAIEGQLDSIHSEATDKEKVQSTSQLVGCVR